jgi:hypothetical protein
VFLNLKPIIYVVFVGALSGWTAATVSLPFDFLKTRLQKMKVLTVRHVGGEGGEDVDYESERRRG